MATVAIERTSITIIGDFLSLAKPRAVLPHFITAAAAMSLAAGGLPPLDTLFLTLTGGGLVAAASNALNCYFDREIDRQMVRTRRRPLPAGRLRPRPALAFGVINGFIGLVVLGRFVNISAAVLALAALVYYLFAYTLLLKRHTRWSALIGSGAGAITPLIGWVAVTNRIEPAPFLLAAIIILWTLPHFWSLAVFRRDDYEQAGLRVLPEKGVAAWIIVCSLLLVAASLSLVPLAEAGIFYLGAASVLGAGFVYLALRMNNRVPLGTAWQLYAYSIFYIAFLFLVIIVDRLIF